MKIRKSLIVGITAATVTAGLATPAQAETHTPTTQVQAAETPNTKSPIGSLNTIFENTPVSYTHLTLPTILRSCRSRWSPYH